MNLKDVKAGLSGNTHYIRKKPFRSLHLVPSKSDGLLWQGL